MKRTWQEGYLWNDNFSVILEEVCILIRLRDLLLTWGLQWIEKQYFLM
jgi:hypothetical protein